MMQHISYPSRRTWKTHLKKAMHNGSDQSGYIDLQWSRFGTATSFHVDEVINTTCLQDYGCGMANPLSLQCISIGHCQRQVFAPQDANL